MKIQLTNLQVYVLYVPEINDLLYLFHVLIYRHVSSVLMVYHHVQRVSQKLKHF